MNNRSTLIAIALGLFAFGCNEHHEHDADAVATADAAADRSQGEQEQTEETVTDATTVTLDNGQRWKANPETTSGIANMVALIDKQIATPVTATEAKAAIEDEFALIFERCTMTGEAHNQLHNYLIPIHQRLSGFDAGDTTQLAEMKSYLNSYTQYFE